jgi:hypothetical protein
MKRISVIFLGLLSLFMISAPAVAIPITYTETGIGSGYFSVPFSDRVITITGVGDTTNVITLAPAPCCLQTTNYLNLLTINIEVSGIGSGTLTDNLAGVFSTQQQQPPINGAGFEDVQLAGVIMFTISPSLSGYDLTTAIGPATGTSFVFSGIDFPTTFAFFALTSIGDTTFTAVTATPLPAALPLFATGLGALGLLGWRRKRKNAATIAA